MGYIYEKAINPKQYDLESLSWTKETYESPFRKFYFEYLKKYKNKWKNATILEIGCGTGWLLNFLEKEASFVEGIDPSHLNIEFAKKNFPKIKVSHISLEKFKSSRKYDLIISVMVLNHIKDIDLAFRKMSRFLKKDGEIQIIVPDYQYAKRPRFNYKLVIEKINGHEYAVETARENGEITDIIRDNIFYKEAGSKTKLSLVKFMPLFPTKDLIMVLPKYEKFKDVAISQLLCFRKN